MARIFRALTRFTKQEIDALFSRAKRVIKHQNAHFLIGTAAKEYGRILIIASRKVGNAPTRNKMRRQLKSIFYEQRLFNYGYDCIVIIKPSPHQLNFQELEKLLISALPHESH